MKKINQKGFGLVEVSLIFVIIALIGGLGFYVYNARGTAGNNDSSTTTPYDKKTTKKDIPAPKQEVDTTITNVNIQINSKSDINNLPTTTPASFKAYITNELNTDKPDTDGCLVAYSITKISQVNIKGGQFRVSSSGNASDQNCMTGGAPNLWVLTPSGNWDRVTLNGPMCKSKNGGLVYKEFAPECYTNTNSSSLVKNPNGSITSLAQ